MARSNPLRFTRHPWSRKPRTDRPGERRPGLGSAVGSASCAAARRAPEPEPAMAEWRRGTRGDIGWRTDPRTAVRAGSMLGAGGVRPGSTIIFWGRAPAGTTIGSADGVASVRPTGGQRVRWTAIDDHGRPMGRPHLGGWLRARRRWPGEAQGAGSRKQPTQLDLTCLFGGAWRLRCRQAPWARGGSIGDGQGQLDFRYDHILQYLLAFVDDVETFITAANEGW